MPRNVTDSSKSSAPNLEDCAASCPADVVAPAVGTTISDTHDSARDNGSTGIAHGEEEGADLADEVDAADARCPLCQGRRLHYAFSSADRRVVRCAECRLVLLNAHPTGAGPREVIAAAPGADVRVELAEDARPEREGETEVNAADSGGAALREADDARSQLQQLARYRGKRRGTMLIVDAGDTGLASEASSLGFCVTCVHLRSGWPVHRPSPLHCPPHGYRGREQRSDVSLASVAEIACADLAASGLAPGSFEVCALTGALETARDPLALLRAVHRLLTPRGVLLVVTPSLDSLCAQLARDGRLGSASLPARLTYFDSDTIQTALHRAGFDQAIVQSSCRPDARLAVSGMAAQAARWVRQALAQALSGDAPHPGGVVAIACAAAVPACRTLSIIVPAYNEAATVGPLLEALLRKRVRGMRIEVIVVESNSSDGTRDVVEKYALHPRLRVVLEDRPCGKGHAVRTGLAQATGDYVLIQDADLEYDLEDYDILLEPLAAGREALVLGSRHGGNAWWKMRRFAGQPFASFALNFGHWFFTTLLNVLFGQRLKDPFTMYKVFRRDCIFGLDFKCNRFDFDYELLVKMIRKGYQPIEIPVNYRSRSFKDGKKVSAFRDPFNWLKALAWLRFVRVDPLAEIERRRGADEGSAKAARPVNAPSRAAA